MEKVDYRPAEQRVMILPENPKEIKTASGIIIPESVDDKRPEIGIVVRAGKGSKDDPMLYHVGERVMYSRYSGLEIKINLKEHGVNVYKVMNQMDIMGTIINAEE